MGNSYDTNNPIKDTNNTIKNNPIKDTKTSNQTQIPVQPQKQRHVDFKIHIAVDFGTDGCGMILQLL